MIDKIKSNKYIRCMLLECNMRNLLILIIALFFGIIIQFPFISSQKAKLAKIKEEQTLVTRMSQKKDVLVTKARNEMPEIPEMAPKKKKNFIIKGIIRNDGTISILINKSIYSVGDQIGDYTIVKINEDSAELRNDKTKAIRKLYFPEGI